MSNNTKYTKTHEWVLLESDDTVTIGISDHAQKSLGDIVYVELPEVGTNITAGKECGVIESVKSASDLYAPISGEVIAINEKVTATPGMINSNAEGAAWLIKVRPSNRGELDSLMDAKAYESFAVSSEH